MPQFTAQRQSEIIAAIAAISDSIAATETHDALLVLLDQTNAARVLAEQQRDAAQAGLAAANDKIARAKAQIEAANVADDIEDAADATGDAARASALSILAE